MVGIPVCVSASDDGRDSERQAALSGSDDVHSFCEVVSSNIDADRPAASSIGACVDRSIQVKLGIGVQGD